MMMHRAGLDLVRTHRRTCRRCDDIHVSLEWGGAAVHVGDHRGRKQLVNHLGLTGLCDTGSLYEREAYCSGAGENQCRG